MAKCLSKKKLVGPFGLIGLFCMAFRRMTILDTHAMYTLAGIQEDKIARKNKKFCTLLLGDENKTSFQMPS